MFKKIRIGLLIFVLLVLAIYFLSSCADDRGNAVADGETTAASGETTGSNVGGNAAEGDRESSDSEAPYTIMFDESAMWWVEILSAELTYSLVTTRAALQYGGGVLETTNEITPSSGYQFLLLGLIIEKTGIGRAAFSWNDARIVDSEGNEFFRHPNDTFLTHLNIPRFRGVDMVFGNEYGYVCFEIPIGAQSLTFVADEGNIVIEITEYVTAGR